MASPALLCCGSLAAQGFAGTWVGEGFTYNAKRVVRTPRETIEIKGSGKRQGTSRRAGQEPLAPPRGVRRAVIIRPRTAGISPARSQ